MFESRILSITIACPLREVYEFVSNPESLPRWAAGLCKSVRKSGAGWIADMPQGPVKIRFAEKNDFGVLDHYVKLSSGVEVYVPMRVVPNSSGSEVIFTLFKTPEMSDKRFAEDAEMVERDLKTLKSVLEK
ncbi:MAG: SRPBCC family protein [Gammaproteobacteria bacterium]|nr:SRPBCC family protein [Gammaproteobacteria bacterium]